MSSKIKTSVRHIRPTLMWMLSSSFFLLNLMQNFIEGNIGIFFASSNMLISSVRDVHRYRQEGGGGRNHKCKINPF